MNKTVTFDGAAPAGTINFGIGQPSADLLPVDIVQQASRSFFEGAEPFELNYGAACQRRAMSYLSLAAIRRRWIWCRSCLPIRVTRFLSKSPAIFWRFRSFAITG